MKKWGFNVIRLGVIWEAVEPSRGKYNLDYLQKMSTLVDSIGKYGISVIIGF